jgi:HEAT repeat protein
MNSKGSSAFRIHLLPFSIATHPDKATAFYIFDAVIGKTTHYSPLYICTVTIKIAIFLLASSRSRIMTTHLRIINRQNLPVATCLLLFFLLGPPRSHAHDEWYRGLDLESVLADSGLALVGRVTDVSETKIGVGGKGERSLLQYKFEPVLVLKGVFSRESLLLTSDDLGRQQLTDAAPIETGQLRLLMLGRSFAGYAMRREALSFDQAIPRLSSPNDELIATVNILLAVNHNLDRAKKVALLLDGLRKQKGAAAIPLLVAVEHRALLAAQTPGAVESIAPHLTDASPAVREQATKTLYSLLKADYLDQAKFHEVAARALAASIARPDPSFVPRVAAFEALGAAGPQAVEDTAVKAQLGLDPLATFAEQGARLHAIGDLKMPGQSRAVLTLLNQLQLDAPTEIQYGAEWAAARLDPSNGVKEVRLRIKKKYDAGLPVVTEIDLLGNLPSTEATSALVDVAKLPLNHDERLAFVSACKKVASAPLVPAIATMLVPAQQDIWWSAVDALVKIDTDDAAKALQPHLLQETNLQRKIAIAEFLGRHGIRDGYPYAIEHMSEPYLREEAISALAAIREPRAVGELRKILETSNDVAWNSAAVRALGALGASDLAPQFLEMAQDTANPLGPSALIALGDLHEVKAVEIARAGFASRNPERLEASARVAGKLLALPGVSADDVRDRLGALLADRGASHPARLAAINSLLALNDRRLDGALALAVRDAGLENSELLNKIEEQLCKRSVKLTLP